MTPFPSRQVNANSFTYEAKNSTNKYHAQGKITVSSDGKTLTFKVKGTNARGEAHVLHPGLRQTVERLVPRAAGPRSG